MEIQGEPLSQEFFNFLLSFYFSTLLFSHVKCIPCSTWTSHCFYYELLSHFCVYVELHAIEGRTPIFAIFKYVIGGRMSRNINLNYARRSTWTSCNKPFSLFVFYSYILIWNTFRVVVELAAVFTLNFCHVFLFNLSHKNFWTFSGRALELLATKL